jgi:uncharacterized phage protein (TIGR01671 family)
MREIKFRAWYKRKKEMLYLTKESSYSLQLRDATCLIASNIGNGETFPYAFFEDIELLQYTGFKDKNHQDIYFGDIIKYSFTDVDNKDNNEQGTALINRTMNNGVGILRDYNSDDTYHVWAVDCGGVMSDLWEDKDLWTIEVIGNIYQNPELVQQ